MLFSSVSFLYYYLPILLIVYFIVPNRYKNAVLLIFSLFFYFFGESVYISILLISTVADYLHGLGIEAYRGTKVAKAILVSSVLINLGLLMLFKYSAFFVQNINALFHAQLPLLGLTLPLGISFYTFQTMSYTIDVYRGEVKAQRNFIDFAAYVTMFPQLVAGPIVRYCDIEPQLRADNRHNSGAAGAGRFDFDGFAWGVGRFMAGLGKKVILANSLGELSKLLYASAEPSVLLYWTAMAAFSLQIYFDFSGYSDMAVGLGRMLGFSFLENFNYPFIADSLTEFWRRWHISLGGWFRDYVYIPLGGSRGGLILRLRNILCVWMLTGFWHGACWNYVLWGLYFGVLLMLEKLFVGRALSRAPKLLRHFYTLLLLSFSFVIFGTEELPLLGMRLFGMFGFSAQGGALPLFNEFTFYHLKSSAWLLLLCVVLATPLPMKGYQALQGLCGRYRLSAVLLSAAELVLMLLLLIVCTAYIVDSSFNPFLYFRF